MTYAKPLSRGLLVLVAAASLSLSGCNQDDKALRAEDDTNPNFHAATAAYQNRDYPGAAKAYEAALRANPDVAEAHFQLGLLYADKLNDLTAAIYHYQQYLKARPSSDNSQNAQERLNAAEIGFAAGLPNSPVQNNQAFVALQSSKLDLQRDLDAANKSVADLQAKLASAQKELAASSPNMQAQTGGANPAAPAPGLQDSTTAAASAAATAANTPPAPPAPAPTAPAVAVNPPPAAQAIPVAAAAPAPAAAGPSQTYTIVSGDTLWKIAKKFYPGNINPGIEKIKAANTDTLPPGKPLKIGTQIQIPQ